MFWYKNSNRKNWGGTNPTDPEFVKKIGSAIQIEAFLAWTDMRDLVDPKYGGEPESSR